MQGEYRVGHRVSVLEELDLAQSTLRVVHQALVRLGSDYERLQVHDFVLDDGAEFFETHRQ